MNIELKNTESLLKKVQAVVKQQKEIEVLKGENFNVFSILKMESKENATHSAFLGELLNPKGSHSKGNVFLKLFLETINYSEAGGKVAYDKAKVKLEHYVGVKDIEKRTGGRIDIYIWDNKGHSISIENKIYANDQEAQIERYCNHNKTKNTVYYLTLKGEEASKWSKGNLTGEQNYYCISYRDTIIDWLDKCLKEAADHPILRESIKQYIILIKKLTNQLTSNHMSNQILTLIKKNYTVANTIAANILKAEISEANVFFNDIKTELEKFLKEGWKITIDKDLKKKYAGLHVTHNTWDGIKIKIEGDTKVFDSVNYYGIRAPKEIYDRIDIKMKLAKSEIFGSDFKESPSWPVYKRIFSMKNGSLRERLFDEEKRKILLEDVTLKLKELAIECLPLLAGVKRIEKVIDN